MYSAPSVSYPVGRSRNAARLLVALWSLGAGAAVVASVHSDVSGWRDGVLFLCVALAATAASVGVPRSPGQASLTFDGQYWSISDSMSLSMAEACVMLDLQRLLLIRLKGAESVARWVWADRNLMPRLWSDLRRALYSRAVPKQTAVKSSASDNVHHSST